ncbi:Exocyst complex component 4 [Armadillidium vulgare]|nr:Exocyst complex component 4 [Armadillidium vulgare]
MNNLAPPKPPSRTRGGKTPPRESNSSLLMSVIRTLSTSESNEQREHEKRHLEKEYKKSDARLEALVVDNAKSFKEAMQIFSVVSSRLSESREKLKTIKENLTACKRLLHCKRDELKERWLEGIEHKHVMLLLEQIEDVQDVGDRIGAFISKKHYLHATQLLMSSLRKLDTDLKKVEALKEVHSDLQTRKEKRVKEFQGEGVKSIIFVKYIVTCDSRECCGWKLCTKVYYKKMPKNESDYMKTLLEDLHKHLYQRWTKEVLALRRQGSGRDSFNSFSRAGSDRMSSGTTNTKSEKARKNLLEMLNAAKNKFTP